MTTEPLPPEALAEMPLRPLEHFGPAPLLAAGAEIARHAQRLADDAFPRLAEFDAVRQGVATAPFDDPTAAVLHNRTVTRLLLALPLTVTLLEHRTGRALVIEPADAEDGEIVAWRIRRATAHDAEQPDGA